MKESTSFRTGRGLLLLAYFLVLAWIVHTGATGKGHNYGLMIAVLGGYWIFVMIKHLFMIHFAYREKRKREKGRELTAPVKEERPLISIIVPAYNEAGVIEGSLRSLARIDYDPYEVIVVDDGSTDGTSWSVQGLLRDPAYKNFRLIRQKNSGKAVALNNGILHAAGEFILCVDADSVVHPDTLSAGIAHFSDPKVGAVAGHVLVASDHNVLLKYQDLEYQVSLNFVRMAFSHFGCVPIVPGPSGLFRRTALVDVGCYHEDRTNFAEDADLSMRLLAAGWKIQSESKMISYTEAPEDLFSLLRQRYRWQRGLFQAWRRNWLSMVTGPHRRGPFLATLLMYETFVSRLLDGFITLFLVTNFLFFTNINLFNVWFAALLLMDFFVLFLFFPNRKKLPTYLVTLLISKVTIHFILLTWSLFALWEEWTKEGMSWDKLARTGQIAARAKA